MVITGCETYREGLSLAYGRDTYSGFREMPGLYYGGRFGYCIIDVANSISPTALSKLCKSGTSLVRGRLVYSGNCHVFNFCSGAGLGGRLSSNLIYGYRITRSACHVGSFSYRGATILCQSRSDAPVEIIGLGIYSGGYHL